MLWTEKGEGRKAGIGREFGKKKTQEWRRCIGDDTFEKYLRKEFTGHLVPVGKIAYGLVQDFVD